MKVAAVTGGAGFLGSHLVERLLSDGWEVWAIDSLITGRWENLSEVGDDPRLHKREHDVSAPITFDGPLDAVFHLASIASPTDYVRLPLETLHAGSSGTHRSLTLADETDASFLLASTSEVYGDPTISPQHEGYRGNVNPVGPRSMYDESKRYAEAYATAYARTRAVRVRIARIFNTYGPKMRAEDGRAVPTFIHQALRGKPITVHGDGTQTRSLCYVDDLIDGLIRLAATDEDPGPVNLGNPDELSILEIAERVRDAVGSDVPIEHVERPPDDPEQRRPDISLARRLGWEPTTSLMDGLRRTIAWAREEWTEPD